MRETLKILKPYMEFIPFDIQTPPTPTAEEPIFLITNAKQKKVIDTGIKNGTLVTPDDYYFKKALKRCEGNFKRLLKDGCRFSRILNNKLYYKSLTPPSGNDNYEQTISIESAYNRYGTCINAFKLKGKFLHTAEVGSLIIPSFSATKIRSTRFTMAQWKPIIDYIFSGQIIISSLTPSNTIFTLVYDSRRTFTMPVISPSQNPVYGCLYFKPDQPIEIQTPSNLRINNIEF